MNDKMRATAAGRRERYYNFSILATPCTCPNSGACRHGCMADNGRMALDTARRAYAENLAMVRDGTIWDRIRGELNAMVRRADKAGDEVRIRIHDSGDFFSAEYLENWLEIVREFPTVRFYAYTKMVSMISAIELPDNMRVVFSYGGKEDRLLDTLDVPKAIVIKADGTVPNGYVDGSHDDRYASEGMSVALRYHGPKSREWTAGPMPTVITIAED